VKVEVTPEAIEVLRRSLALAPNAVGVRLRVATALGGGTSVQIELADGPLEGEATIESDGVRVFVDPGALDSIPDHVLTVEPQHERLVLRSR
jgi:Fe-S cluster assembly iron-binding protein IscA